MWLKVGIGGEHHRYYKHTKFHQNPSGDPKFLVDLTQNDPIVKLKPTVLASVRAAVTCMGTLYTSTKSV